MGSVAALRTTALVRQPNVWQPDPSGAMAGMCSPPSWGRRSTVGRIPATPTRPC
jgi:hypothetical protein